MALKLFIFWGSYLWFLFIPACVWGMKRGRLDLRVASAVALFASSVPAYARFVEPRLLSIHHTDIVLPGASAASPDIRLALFSDTHFGIYQNAMPMHRIVEKLNAETPDAVLIAGDFLYHLAPMDIPVALAALKEIERPVFAVLGNHDVGFPGPDLGSELSAALRALNVQLIENRRIPVSLNGQRVYLQGVSDLWQDEQRFDGRAVPQTLPLILLTHNPDTAHHVPCGLSYDLMLAGHTHGGQIRIPGLVQRVIPTSHPFDKGLHKVETNCGTARVFVTSGTGMVGLPMRFNMKPRIDILTIKLPTQD